MNIRTFVTVALLSIVGFMGFGAAQASAGITPPASSCATSPYCYTYTTQGGMHLSSKAGSANEVIATTSSSPSGLSTDTWYADHPAALNGAARFQLFRGGQATGKYLNEVNHQLVMGPDSMQGFFFNGDCNATCTGTWSDNAGLVWTASSNGGHVNLAPAKEFAGNQQWTTEKPTF